MCTWRVKHKSGEGGVKISQEEGPPCQKHRAVNSNGRSQCSQNRGGLLHRGLDNSEGEDDSTFNSLRGDKLCQISGSEGPSGENTNKQDLALCTQELRGSVCGSV